MKENTWNTIMGLVAFLLVLGAVAWGLHQSNQQQQAARNFSDLTALTPEPVEQMKVWRQAGEANREHERWQRQRSGITGGTIGGHNERTYMAQAREAGASYRNPSEPETPNQKPLITTNHSTRRYVTNRAAVVRALPPGHGLVLSISNQIAALQRKKAALGAKSSEASLRYQLEFSAHGYNEARLRANEARLKVVRAQESELNRQIAVLLLKEHDYRKLYRITNAPAVRRKK